MDNERNKKEKRCKRCQKRLVTGDRLLCKRCKLQRKETRKKIISGVSILGTPVVALILKKHK